MSNTKPDDLEAVRKVVEAITEFDAQDQERILRWSREKVGLSPEVAVPIRPPAPGTDPLDTSKDRTKDIKSFVDEKNPSSQSQFAATVAYYYKFEAPEHLRKDSVTAEDLQEACRLAGRARMAKPAQTLIDTKALGLLDRGERGAYAINTVGENLVAMALPSESGRVITKKGTRKVNTSAAGKGSQKPARKVAAREATKRKPRR